jgi:hypothetical protein
VRPNRALIASDTIHIDEGTIIAGSAALSLAVPALLTGRQGKRVVLANPEEARRVLKEDGVVVVDVRAKVCLLLMKWCCHVMFVKTVFM